MYLGIKRKSEIVKSVENKIVKSNQRGESKDLSNREDGKEPSYVSLGICLIQTIEYKLYLWQEKYISFPSK